MKTLLLALLVAVPSASFAQEEEEPASEAGTSMGGAGIGKGDADSDPAASRSSASDDSCTGPALPVGKFTVADGNGWFPKVSPNGEWIAYGFGKVGAVNVRTRIEKVIDPRHAFTAGWIRPASLMYDVDGVEGGTQGFFASPPAFASTRMPDDSLVAANKHAAADGHWAGYLAGGGFRMVYDGKVVQMGTGGSPDVSEDWLVHFATNDNQLIRVRKGGKIFRDYVPKYPSTEVTITRGYVVYAGPGKQLHGITPAGQDVDLTVAPPGFLEAGAKVFFVGRGAAAKPWVASVMWGNSGPCYTMLRPWGKKTGMVLDDCASGMSVVEHCGVIVIARNSDKGRLNVVTASVPAHLQSMEDIAALKKKIADGANGMTTWMQPVFGASGSGVVQLAGTAVEGVTKVDILVNLQKVGTAQLSDGIWAYALDTSPYQGGINLSTLATGAGGKTARDTIRFNVR
jgi:hypothetical protein